MVAAFGWLLFTASAQGPAGVRPPDPQWEKKLPTTVEKEEAEGELYFDQIRRSGPKLPEDTRTSPWTDALQVPFWTDAKGVHPSWECIGPAPLDKAWGGSDNSGRVSTIAVDPRNTRRLYIGASLGGVWKSTNGGQNWRPMSDFEASLSFGSLVLDPFNPDIIYAGTGEAHGASDSYFGAGILRSTNAGETWELLGSEELNGTAVAKMVASTKVRGLLIAATGRGLMRSLNGGNHWQAVVEGAFTDVVNSDKRPDVYYAVGGLGGKNGVYKTTDSGNTWELLGGTLPHNSFGRSQLAQCRDFPDTVYVSYAVGWGNGIAEYRTDDGGRSWRLLKDAPNYGGGQLWYDNFYACAPDNPNIVFGGGYSILRTLDGGSTWLDVSRSYSGGNTHPDWHCFIFDPIDPKVMYTGCDGGLFMTKDRGDTWEAISNNLATLQFIGIDVDPISPFVAYGGTQDNGTSRTRGDLRWKETFFGDGGWTIVDYQHPERVYTEYVGLSLHRSDDYGDSWYYCVNNMDTTGGLFYAPFEIDPNNSDILVAGASRVWRTTNRTDSWEAISGDMGHVSALAIAPKHSEVIYAGSSWGRVWVTPNTGGNWFDITAGLPGGHIATLAVDPRSPRTAYVGVHGYGHKHIFKTENAGGTWRSVDDNLPDAPFGHIVIDPTRPDDVYIAGDVGVYVSNSGGGNWKRYGTGLPNCPCMRLALNRRTGYLTVGTHGRSLWKVRLPDYKTAK